MSGYGFKARLKEVLRDAVSNFQDSGDPNDACIKAANSAGFNPDQADRLVETFNTARVICNYKNADDRTSSCSLADKDTVHAGLAYVPETKAAESVEADYSPYLHDEQDYFIAPGKKAAETISVTLDDGSPSANAVGQIESRRLTSLRQLAKSAAEEARGARDLADRQMSALASRISRNVSLRDVHEKVASIVAAYALDERYAPAVEKLAEFLPPSSDPDRALLDKYASRHIVDTSDVEEYVPALKEASDLIAEAAALEAFSDDMLTDVKSAEARLYVGVKEAQTLGGFVRGPADSVQDTLLDTYRRDFADRKSDAIKEVSNLKRKLVLQDLLLRDKIISQEDPNKVMDAYRSIHQIAPDSTLNREVLRSMLRQAVQSVAISPYDAKTLADVDKSRRQAYGSVPMMFGDND